MWELLVNVMRSLSLRPAQHLNVHICTYLLLCRALKKNLFLVVAITSFLVCI